MWLRHAETVLHFISDHKPTSDQVKRYMKHGYDLGENDTEKILRDLNHGGWIIWESYHWRLK
jgi:hypothetical protein